MHRFSVQIRLTCKVVRNNICSNVTEGASPKLDKGHLENRGDVATLTDYTKLKEQVHVYVNM